MMKLEQWGCGSRGQSTKHDEIGNLIRENQFSDFYIFRCIELRLLLCNSLIMHIHLLEVAGGC